jgi:hypothetical protein
LLDLLQDLRKPEETSGGKLNSFLDSLRVRLHRICPSSCRGYVSGPVAIDEIGLFRGLAVLRLKQLASSVSRKLVAIPEEGMKVT